MFTFGFTSLFDGAVTGSPPSELMENTVADDRTDAVVFGGSIDSLISFFLFCLELECKKNKQKKRFAEPITELWFPELIRVITGKRLRMELP